MKKYIVYEHISPSGKRYIGITANPINRRWGSNGSGYAKQQKFYNAIQRYGWNNFQHNILYENLTDIEASKKEQELIKKYNTIENGYNCEPGGVVNKMHSEETKEKIRKANLGEKNPMYGKHPSEETRQKLSRARRGKAHSQEWVLKVAEAKKKKVLCITTGEIFNSVNEAAIAIGRSPTGISMACSGKRKTCGKDLITNKRLEWRYL